ncbi:MAG: single-stranded DNA-binding protein [Chloroflexi bacterium]|nr:single-stranded DNA-binding protein [Chloroflexota bacterium]
MSDQIAMSDQQDQRKPKPKSYAARRSVRHTNFVVVIGSLCREPRYAVSRAGKPIATLTLAVDRPEDVSPKIVEEGARDSDYPVVSLQGDAVQALAGILRAGTTILAVGIWQTRNYLKDGERRTANEMLARRVWVLGGVDQIAHVSSQVETMLTGIDSPTLPAPFTLEGVA